MYYFFFSKKPIPQPNPTRYGRMFDVTMMDSAFSRPIEETTRRPETSMLLCDGEQHECGEGEMDRGSSSALATTSVMASGYKPTELEGALRIMTHAGRILWRAALEAIPGSKEGFYSPPLGVLSKLFQRSFGKHTKGHRNKTPRTTKPLLFSTTKADDNHVFTDTDESRETGEDHAMAIVPDSVCDCSEQSFEEPSDEILSPPKKRKVVFAISSLLPSVVSDSEEEEKEHDDDDDDVLRPPKRVRRDIEKETTTHYW